MIEITPDSPFAGKPDPLFPDRVRIIGLGQTGAAVCDQIILHGRASQDIWVFDSDQQVIEGSIVPNRQLLGRNLVHGLGSSGDMELAREIVALEESRLVPVTRGCDFMILVLGLGGCTGMALAEYLIEEGKKSGARVIVVAVQPFAFEGWARREKAIAAIAQLRREADSVLVLSHDRLTEDPVTAKNVRHGFHMMHQMMGHVAQALVQIVCKRGLVQLSFADVRSLYGRYAGSEVLENCWVAHSEGEIHDRPEELVERLLDTPLIRDESIWKKADHAIVTISGTRDLGLSDVQDIVGALKDRLPPKLPLVASASLEEDNHDKVRLTVLLAMTASVPAAVVIPEPKKKTAPRKTVEQPEPISNSQPLVLEPEYAEEELPEFVQEEEIEEVEMEEEIPEEPAKPAPVAKKPSRRANGVMDVDPLMAIAKSEPVAEPFPIEPIPTPTQTRFVAKQEEMEFEAPTRGRFEKTHETIYNGENLDYPTFRRRNLVIRL